ncbi:unnamed protein product [Arctia plantaginis]|uniref:Uncharacterized protein n=1 Tax=Arctia plantaginis TaxID=874455 RepID=A0A8S0YZB1_ARCPL|nr:unnamed protein product [Arctia plantaginis]
MQLKKLCRIYEKRHHTLLHEPRPSRNIGGSSQGIEQPQIMLSNVEDKGHTSQHNNDVSNKQHKFINLSVTAVVIVKNQKSCLITERVVQLLKYTRYPIKGSILGVGFTASWMLTLFKSKLVLLQCEIYSYADDTALLGYGETWEQAKRGAKASMRMVVE